MADAGPQRQKQEVAALFGRAASSYDQIGPRFFTQLGARLVDLADIRPGQAVLDVGCGRGASLLPAAERAAPTGRVVGIDLAEGMVARLRREIDERGLPDAEVQVMDGEHLLFPAATFDCVLCGFCLFFFPDHERALAEMRRVLKPGGRLGISTWGNGDEAWGWLDDLFDDYLPEPEPSAEQTGDEERYTESPVQMRAVLRRAGFAHVEVVTETREFAYATEDEWWAALWSHGMREGLEQIETRSGPEGLARFKADALRQLRLRQPSAGALALVLPILYTLAARPRRQS